MKKFLVFFWIAFLVTNLAAQRYSRVAIPNATEQLNTLSLLAIPYDDGFLKKDGTLILELSEKDLQKLENQNVNFEVLIPDVKEFYKKRIGQASWEVPKEAPSHFHLGSMGGNLTFDEMLAELDSMRHYYPDLISEKIPISTDTTTEEGRILYYVKISDNPDQDEDEPEVLFTGLHHAREPVSMMQLIYLMWWMLENYGTDPEATYFVDNFEVYFVPCVNPDGYVYNQTTDPNGGGMWRKNRRNNGNGEYGVDLNRNYSFNWGYDDSGSSPDPSSDTYRGPSPASEPETQLMIKFIENHDFKLILNHHTYSNLLIYPYGYDEVYPEDFDVFHTYALIMTRENHYEIGTPWELLYPVNGDANDWAYGTHQILAMTPETGGYSDGFWPSPERIVPLCEGNMEMNKYLIRLTGAYAEPTDIAPAEIKNFGYFPVKINFLGQDTTATFKIYLSGDDLLYSDTLFFSDQDYSLLQSKQGQVFYVINTDIANGDSVNLNIVVDNGLMAYKFPLGKKIMRTETIFYDSCENMSNWNSSTWNITDESYVSPSHSITDSPGSNYDDQSTTEITSNAFDFSEYDDLTLAYQAKWELESSYDFTYLLISTDGGNNWQYLSTSNMTEDGNENPAYNGTSDWVAEAVDISQYVSDNVKFKFQLVSDVSINYDGFYFDDFVITALYDNEAPVITGQQPVTIDGTNQYQITSGDLTVQDPDSQYPDDFFILALPGENYQVENFNTVVINSGYSGELTVPVVVSDGYDWSEPYNFNIAVNSTSVADDENLLIYPNPAGKELTIQMTKQYNTLIISDLYGKTLLRQNINSRRLTVDIGNLAEGVYILKLVGKNEVLTKTFVK